MVKEIEIKIDEEFHQIMKEIEKERTKVIKLTYLAIGFFVGSIMDTVLFLIF